MGWWQPLGVRARLCEREVCWAVGSPGYQSRKVQQCVESRLVIWCSQLVFVDGYSGSGVGAWGVPCVCVRVKGTLSEKGLGLVFIN